MSLFPIGSSFRREDDLDDGFGDYPVTPNRQPEKPMNKDTDTITYKDLIERLNELSPEQLDQPARVTVGKKIYPIIDTALSCECSGPAVKLVGENCPLFIGSGFPMVQKTIR